QVQELKASFTTWLCMSVIALPIPRTHSLAALFVFNLHRQCALRKLAKRRRQITVKRNIALLFL
ncbi:hypothetical protein ABFV62_29640, partial [Pseudomonas syringae]|uniref:hypothetical protein n=1 Tax=Pseudomonas syringae TaxID=317 RepID=UPI0034D55F65